ncbi:MAG: pitrilysin family protein [Candidatus Pacearchaeota archaeon]|jgi:predicted Zn-dependent peptidase
MKNIKENFRKKVLDNGMTILFEKRSVPVVSCAFAVRAGSINETLEEKGIFHFTEHMLYKGTPTRNTKKIAEEIERNGGELNGFTSEKIVAYWCKMPSEKINVALDVLGDMVRNPLFDQKELEKERKVVFEEIKMNHDTPMRHVFHKIGQFLYEPKMALDVLGTYETLKNVTNETMKKKFEQIYKPNNMILCVVGDCDFDNLIKFCEDNFNNEKGEIPKQKFELSNSEEVEERGGIDQANLVFAYHVSLAGDKKNYAASVLSTMMGGGLSSRLFSEIREKRNLAYAVKADDDINSDYAFSFVYVGTMKENVEKVKELILKEFKKVSEELDEKELEEVKTQIIGQYKISMEDSQSQMVNLLASEVNGRAEEFYEFEENIKNVKLEDVRKIAKSAIEKFSFFALVPK